MSQPKIDWTQIELAKLPAGTVGSMPTAFSFTLAPVGAATGPSTISSWAKAITEAAGQSTSVISPDYDTLRQTLSGHISESFETKGLFFVPVPTEQNAGVLSIYADARDSSTTNIGKGRTRLTDEIIRSQDETIQLWNSLNFQTPSAYLSDSEQGKIWFLGPISNSVIKASAGNNIVFASPVLYQSQWNKTEEDSILFTGYDRHLTKTIFFPSSQGIYKSNKITLGSGNDIVYYDSSFGEIRGGSGENIFLPSFGSFNWALQLSLRPLSRKSFEDVIHNNKNTFANNATVFLTNPVPTDQNVDFSANNIYTFAIQTYDIKDHPPFVQGKQVYYGSSASSENNSLNRIGGQTIIGGPDGDIFYGIDPSFYDGVPLQVMPAVPSYSWPEIEIKRYAFLNPSADSQNQRYNIQKFETVQMFGGEGSDIFYFGNPGHIDISAQNRTGVAAYIVAGSHSQASRSIDREDLAWADHDHAPNTYVFNLSTSATSYTNQSSSIDATKGEQTGALDAVQAGYALLKSTLTFAAKAGKKVPYFEVISAGIDLAKTVYSTVNFISKALKPDPEPIKTTSEALSIPVANWKNQVVIDDWSPSDSIRITVDTTYRGNLYNEAQNARWKNNGLFIEAQKGSEVGDGSKIVWKEGKETINDLIAFPGFNFDSSSMTNGYKAYNFKTASYEWITAKHLDIFGHISLGNEREGISPLRNYTADNGFVFASERPGVVSASPEGSYIFYWNDTVGLSAKGLDEARQKSAAITIDFDPRKLGWYWQPAFKQATIFDSSSPESVLNSLELDTANSRLWYNKGSKWEFYTYDQIETNISAMITALRSKTFYAVTQGGAEKREASQVANEKLINGLFMLGDYFTELGNLQQGWTTGPRLEKLYEVTGVSKTDSGVLVYFAKDSGTFSMAVREVDGQAVAEPPKPMLKMAVRAVESAAQIDIDADGVIADLDEVLAESGYAGTYAFNAYKDILDRDPTTEELEIAVKMIGVIDKPAETLSELPTVEKLIEQLVLSEEFLAQAAESPMPFVELLYEELLGVVTPDPAHVQYFVDLINAGFIPVDIAWLFLKSDVLDQVFTTVEGSVEIIGVTPDPGI